MRIYRDFHAQQSLEFTKKNNRQKTCSDGPARLNLLHLWHFDRILLQEGLAEKCSEVSEIQQVLKC